MTIPTNIRVPFMAVEIDPSRAFQGPALLEYQAIIMGQKLSSGSKEELGVYLVSSADQAAEFFGNGSQLHRMAIAWFANNKTTPVYMAPIDDNGAGVAASGTYTITGTATVDGTFFGTIAGKLITSAISSGDTADDVGASLAVAINNSVELPVTAANVSGVVTLTAKNKGESGNEIDLRLNFNDGEVLPSGLSVVTVAMGSGSTNPDVQEILDVLGDEWYNIWIGPWTDTVNLGKLETELTDRFGPTRMLDALYICSKRGSLGTLSAFGNARNNPHVCCIASEKYPSESLQVAAAAAGRIAAEGSADPARPFQTLQLSGIVGPSVTERFSFAENNTLLFDGISTIAVDSGGVVRVQRAITMYQKNVSGAPDIAYLDVNTMLTLMYLRYDFRVSILTKYPRSKLADDGVNVQAGMSVITPKVGKAEAIAKFRQWEFLGLTENIDQFKNDLKCQRSTVDPNRLEWLLPPDLVNQFRVGAATLQFLLQSPSF